MKNTYKKELMQQCYNDYKSGKPVPVLIQEYNIPRSTLYTWIKRLETTQPKPNYTKKEFLLLQNKIRRLNTIIEILQSVDCSPTAPLQEKLEVLEDLYGKYNVHIICEALNVPRGTFYNHILRNKRDNTCYAKRKEELRLKIQEIYDESNQIFGSKKIAAILKGRGVRVSEKMVLSLMQDMGLVSIRMNSKKIYDKEQRAYKNHLNQQFNPDKPNQVWVSDITYFRFNKRNYYICAIIDLYARAVIAYHVSTKNSAQLVKTTFKKAYEKRKPAQGLIFHTDRGSNYHSYTFTAYLKSLGVVQSSSRAHVPYDNSVMEAFFKSFKAEELYRRKYRSENEFKTAIDGYMVFYNERRPHAKNGYKTPYKKEELFLNNQAT